MTHILLPKKPGKRPGTFAGSDAQKRPPIFYGWWIVVSSSLITLLTNGFVMLGFTALFEPIADEFGWSYTQISFAASLRGIEVGVMAPVVGVLVDHWGPRRLTVAGIILVGFGLFFLSRINSLGMFYVGFTFIALGFSCLSPTVLLTTTAHWFRKRLGVATGISASGFALGGVMVPLVVLLIDAYSWRTALVILGLITLVTCFPLATMLRHKPEQYGLLPDGEKTVVTSPHGMEVKMEVPEAGFTLRQVLRSRPFWHMGVAMMFIFLALSTMTAHIMPYLSSIGMARSSASLVAMAVPLVSIAGRIGSGWLSDRFSKKKVATGLFGLIALGLLCTSFASSETLWLIAPFIVFFGIGWGGSTISRVSLISTYFGRSNFGSIFGMCMGMAAMGTVIGPIFAGWVYDNWGSYQITWPVLTVLVLVGMITLYSMPAPAANPNSAAASG